EVQAAPAAKETGGEVVDLLAALQRSVERAKASRGEPTAQTADEVDDEDTAEADLAPDESARKAEKRTAKRAAAKKTATGKPGARKTATKKRAAS
ncbi:MAG: Ku protein, partial [Dermatophilaceae bacterium]